MGSGSQKIQHFQGLAGFVQILPWHTKSIFVKYDQPPEKPVSAPFCSPFAGQK
jgi:hypothetical protein